MKIIHDPTATSYEQKKGSAPQSLFFKITKYAFFALSSFLAVIPLASTNADFRSESVIEGTAFGASCWATPSVPVHQTPEDGFVAHFGNPWLNNPVLDWLNSTSSCPTATITYDVAISTDPNFSTTTQTATGLSASQALYLLTVDGTYYWRVRATDQFGHSSAYSSPWMFVIDRQSLSAPQMIGWNLSTESARSGEMPVDLVCGDTTNGGNVDLPFISHIWTPSESAGVKYHQQVVYPSGAVGDFFYIGPANTQFWYMGAYPGIEGLWRVRVRTYVDANNNGRFDTGEMFSPWSSYCNLTLDKSAPSIPEIVINEVYPSPAGDDSSAMPNGEWVELYNRSGADIDVNGWVLYDQAEHPLYISNSAVNADNNLNPFDQGETIVPAHGFLVVYRNSDAEFDLDDTGDTVSLYTGPIGSGSRKDAYQFGSTAEGKSIARIGDGANNWIDPLGTTCRHNVEHQHGLQPSVNVYQQDAHHLQVGLFDAINYQQAQVTVKYLRNQEGQEVQEQLTKTYPISQLDHYFRDIFMGSVSSGTEYPHFGISQVTVDIVLTGSGIPDRTLSVSLSTDWSETL